MARQAILELAKEAERQQKTLLETYELLEQLLLEIILKQAERLLKLTSPTKS